MDKDTIEVKVGMETKTRSAGTAYLKSDIEPQPIFAHTENIRGFPRTIMGIVFSQGGEAKVLLQIRDTLKYDGDDAVHWTGLLFTPHDSIHKAVEIEAEVAHG